MALWGQNRGWTPVVCVDAWSAFETTLSGMAYDKPRSAWVERECPTGIGDKDCQPSGVDCSLHNYGLAIDIDPFELGNDHFGTRFGDGWSFGDTRVTRPQVEAIEGIRTLTGTRVFRWLGWSIGDTMHFQIDCRPSDLAAGIDWGTVPNGGEDELKLASRGDVGDHVATYMELLHRRGFTPVNSREADGRWDGNYGPGMAKAVGAFIAANGGPDTFPGEGPDTIGPIMRAALISNTP